MSQHESESERLAQHLRQLTLAYQRTRMWFWRTGVAALAAAGLWIVGFVNLPSDAGPRQTVGIIGGALVMWILFLVAFRLQRRLGKIYQEIERLRRLLIG